MQAQQEEKKSRIGKLPVPLPSGVQVTVAGRDIKVKGPKGELNRMFPSEVSVEILDGSAQVNTEGGSRRSRAMHGLSRALLNNMVVGVTRGFERKLSIIGVGYRAELTDKRHILFNLGYSHPILYELPEGITAELAKKGEITLRGIDKEVLGLSAAKIRSFRAPEPYKGKGIRYSDEHVRRKAGKAAAR